MKRAIISIHGIVQGVGFRPFIHRLAGSYKLCGFIKNTSSGVEVELEGEEEALRAFVSDLPEKAPKLAVIDEIIAETSDELVGYEGFEIRGSKTELLRNTLISPDICICDDCLRELFTPGDRRYRYPFINCTNCGPRFTIIKDVPYDRVNTSMSGFPMCPECDAEYKDIGNRRYHAQPDCCPECGPEVFFLDAEGTRQSGDAIENAGKLIKSGGICAIKGLGGMHLACRCDDPEIAQRLRKRKHRDEKPFAVMCRDAEAAKKLCFVSAEEEKILMGFRRPIVLLKKRDPRVDHLSENGYLGVMLPYTPLHYLLFGDDIDMLVMTSANLSDTPIMYRNEEALECLKGIADGYLLHDRDIQTRCDDSLAYVLDGSEYFLRRSRGYVPFPIRAGGELQVLACGAEQKASFSLSREGRVFQSQHIGDLKNMETFSNYEQQIAHFENLFDIKPRAVACDMHPDYMSTAFAEELGERLNIPVIKVQHHHAHMVSCMADNGLTGRVIGLVWDGTGYGTDGTVWGGECLVGDEAEFERFGSILPIPLPGGEKAIHETERTAYSLLSLSGCDASGLFCAKVCEMLLRSGLNTPLSSGMGRLFDGVSAILGIKTSCSYEGQGAILLEAAACETDRCYTVCFDEKMRFDWRPMIREIVSDLTSGVTAGEAAGAFLNTLIEMGAQQCLKASEKYGIDRVVLSGGTFQNMVLITRLPKRLAEIGLKPYRHRRCSTNDEGISLGQLIAAQARMEKNVSCNTSETD